MSPNAGRRGGGEATLPRWMDPEGARSSKIVTQAYLSRGVDGCVSWTLFCGRMAMDRYRLARRPNFQLSGPVTIQPLLSHPSTLDGCLATAAETELRAASSVKTSLERIQEWSVSRAPPPLLLSPGCIAALAGRWLERASAL